MYDVTAEAKISAPADKVWGLITDVSGYADLLSGVISAEQLDDLPEFGVGTSWRETRRMFGKEATEEMTVSEVDPGRSYTTVAESHGAKYVSRITVEPTERGCTLTITFAGEPTSTFAAIMARTVGRLFTGATRNALQKDLDEIAAAAEAQD